MMTSLWTECSIIPKDTAKLNSIEGINFESNQLEGLPSEFSKLENLQDLNLMDNKFSKWPQVLNSLKNLKEINLSHNGISSIDLNLSNLASLQKLWLHSNQIKELSGNFSSTNSLTHLYLWNNQIQSIPSEIKNLSLLEILHIRQNQITSLPEEIGALNKLTVLELSFNQLKSLPESLGNLANLKGLYLTFNQLANLPRTIGKLSKLELLDVSFNKIESLPSDLKGLQKLKVLSAFGNSISEIPDSIGSLNSLNELYLGGNEISSLPVTIGNLKNLNILDLSDNKLSKLPDEFVKLKQLEYLSLRNNNISSLPDSFKRMRGLKTIHLDGNPLTPEALRKIKSLLPNTVIIHLNQATPNQRLKETYRLTMTKLNSLRVNNGAPPLEMDFRLSLASEAHARYLIANKNHPSIKGLGAHNQNPNMPLYSEEGAKKEFRYGTQGEVLSSNEAELDQAIDTWHHTILHRKPITGLGFLKVGFGFSKTIDNNISKSVLRVVGLNYQYMNMMQNTAPAVKVYPYENQKNVPLTMINEIPNTTPLEDEDQIVGFPIVIKFNKERSYDLKNFRATMTDSSGKNIPLWIIQPSDNKYGIGGQSEIWIMSKDPLSSNEEYAITAEGNISGGRIWKKEWSFTTEE
jgi:Leucine-rich repeat (LRR) protein